MTAIKLTEEKTMGEPSPNPGTDAAISLGCTCPVLDNHYGEGVPTSSGPVFWYSDSCKLHNKPPNQKA